MSDTMWLWICDECATQLEYEAGKVPEGWEIDEDEDIIEARAICEKCVAKGLSA